MGFRVWPFWMGWNNKKIPTEKTEFHSTAHVIVFLELSKLSDIFLCHEKKNVKELSVEYWLFKKGIPIEMVYFIIFYIPK